MSQSSSNSLTAPERPGSIRNVSTSVVVDGDFASRRRAAIIADPSASISEKVATEAVAFSTGTPVLAVRRNVTKDTGPYEPVGNAGNRTVNHVFSGLSGVTPEMLGIPYERSSFVAQLLQKGFSEKYAEEAWNDLLMTRIRVVGVASSDLTGKSLDSAVVRGNVAIPTTTPLTTGDHLEFYIPPSSEVKAIEALGSNVRDLDFQPKRGQIGVRPVSSGNLKDSFSREVLLGCKAPRITKDIASNGSGRFSDAVLPLAFVSALMAFGYQFMASFMLKTGLVLGAGNGGTEQEQLTLNGAPKSFMDGNGDYQGTPTDAAEHAEIMRFFFKVAGVNRSVPQPRDLKAAIEFINTAPAQVNVLAQMLVPGLQPKGPSAIDTHVKTAIENHAEMKDALDALNADLLQSMLAGMFFDVDGAPKPAIEDFFGSFKDSTGSIVNPAFTNQNSSWTFNPDSTLGQAGLQATQALPKMTASAFTFATEKSRNRAGVVMGGGVFPVGTKAPVML